MKKRNKVFLVIFSLFMDLLIYAQPTDEDNNGDLEGGDPPAAPINTFLYILAVIGILYVFYKVNKSRVKNNFR